MFVWKARFPCIIFHSVTASIPTLPQWLTSPKNGDSALIELNIRGNNLKCHCLHFHFI